MEPTYVIRDILKSHVTRTQVQWECTTGIPTQMVNLQWPLFKGILSGDVSDDSTVLMMMGYKKRSANKCRSEMNPGSKGNRPLHAGQKDLKRTSGYLLKTMSIARRFYQSLPILKWKRVLQMLWGKNTYGQQQVHKHIWSSVSAPIWRKYNGLHQSKILV